MDEDVTYFRHYVEHIAYVIKLNITIYVAEDFPI